MLQKNSLVSPADKCGVLWVNIFHLYKGSFRKTSFTGDFVKISVRLTEPENWVKKKSKYKAMIVRTKKETIKRDGSWLKFDENNVVLFKKRTSSLGTEIVGPTLKTVNRKVFLQSFSGLV